VTDTQDRLLHFSISEVFIGVRTSFYSHVASPDLQNHSCPLQVQNIFSKNKASEGKTDRPLTINHIVVL